MQDALIAGFAIAYSIAFAVLVIHANTLVRENKARERGRHRGELLAEHGDVIRVKLFADLGPHVEAMEAASRAIHAMAGMAFATGGVIEKLQVAGLVPATRRQRLGRWWLRGVTRVRSWR